MRITRHGIGALRLALAAATLCLAACGEGIGPGYRPPLATLKGRITRSPVALPDSLRAALLWSGLVAAPQDLGPGMVGVGSTTLTAQDVPIRDVRLPARFELAIDDLPPQSVLFGEGANRAGLASLVVYDDVDGDQHLGLTPPAGPPAADRLYLTSPRLIVEYLESPVDLGGVDAGGFTLGFGAVGIPLPSLPPTCSEAWDPNEALSRSARVPLSDLAIELVDAPQPAPCELGPFSFFDCLPAAGEAVQCNADGSGYLTRALDRAGTVCEQRVLCAARTCPGPAAPFCPQP